MTIQSGIRPGYKQTEVGVIPEDWIATNLKNCCSKITDGTHDTPEPVRFGVPFLTAIHVKEGRIDYESCLFVTPIVHAEIFSRCNPEKNDVLIVNIGAGVATTAIVDVEYEFSLKNVALLKPDTRKVSGFFLRQCLARTKLKTVQGLLSGGAQPFLSLRQIGQIEIAVPPTTAEQHAIAAALSDADTFIAALERMIAKKRNLKQAAMQHFLTGKTRLPGFSGEWEVKRLGDFSIFLPGTYLAKTDYRPGSFVVQGAGAEMGEHNTANFPFAISVIGRVGTVGRPRYMPTGCWVNNNAAAIKSMPNESEPRYVHLLLAQYDWSLATSVTAQPFLGIKSLMGSLHRLPPKAEQSAIAEVIFDMDADLATLEAQAAKARAVKQGMMQELLTGRVRLV